MRRTLIYFCLSVIASSLGPSTGAGDDATADLAVQAIYRSGVPHIANNGQRIRKYDPGRSFFVIGLWGAPESRVYRGIDYRWHHLVEAGFNTVWPWPMGGYTTDSQLQQAARHGLKVVLMRRPGEEALHRIAEHPALLAIVWQDEPLINFPLDEQTHQIRTFEAYRDLVHRIAPRLPVLVNTSSWMVGQGRRPWIDWHRAGDLSCHDNYVIWPTTRSINLGSYGKELNGIADSMSLAVQTSEQGKPVWLVVQAFESEEPDDAAFPFRYPTPRQLRAMVYTALIHGATGITYYGWDSNITRFGISPHGHREIPGCPTATPSQARRSRELWETAAKINQELRQLAPALLSPTVAPDKLSYTIRMSGESITPAPIRTLLKTDPRGGCVLLMVNMDSARLVVTLRLDRPKWQTRRIVFNPFDVHVLRLASEN